MALRQLSLSSPPLSVLCSCPRGPLRLGRSGEPLPASSWGMGTSPVLPRVRLALRFFRVGRGGSMCPTAQVRSHPVSSLLSSGDSSSSSLKLSFFFPPF